ncbi:MAG: STAS domain-containing protein [Candidatus Hinthialibacter antarcticus]|nr:STAS domain-containing protein [Candidatus Hinthialibacter antarcticus]
MNCLSSEIGDVLIIQFRFETLDANNAKMVRQEVDPIIQDRKKVAVDMSEVQFIDSSGLGTLLTFYRKVKSVEGSLLLYGMTSQAMSLFELVKMDRIFEVVESQDDAIHALNGDAQQ